MLVILWVWRFCWCDFGILWVCVLDFWVSGIWILVTLDLAEWLVCGG